MRPRPLLWLLISALCFIGTFYFWRLGDQRAAQRGKAEGRSQKAASRTPQHATGSAPLSPFKLLSAAGNLNSAPDTLAVTNRTASSTNGPVLRLSNTTASLHDLQRSERAILLENALLDTAQAVPSIPDHLRAHGDPGAWLVQARGPIDNAFRAVLREAGATVVAYIPNNAYLVRASAGVAQQLRGAPRTQAVLPYEPYYKLKPSLLKLAVTQAALPAHSALNVLVFADGREATRAELEKLGATIVGSEESSPFGPVLRVVPAADGLAALAGLAGVQEVEWVMPRVAANDFSRARIGVATDAVTVNNYLGLSGTNVLVNLNDTGVDATHPDLLGRMFAPDTNSLVDYNGHGTHVAGTIASSGGQSLTVTNASGPSGPYSGTNGQFRGMAPAASLYVLPIGLSTGPFSVGETFFWPSDSYLQQTAAQTNAFISNNSWNYVGPDAGSYDLHAASYDAAVRDALPTVPGSRPLLYVFSAGNAGRGNDDGTAGNPGTIESPATAKNVITVGAIEQLRNLTNQVWKCHPPDSTNSCSTNKPWMSETDANDQVAGFSSRGPVGRGVEGDAGRFKPDLVAPGVFVISTKSQQWDTNAYYNPTSHHYFLYQDIFIPTNMLYLDSIPVPDNAVGLNISVFPNTNSPVPFPDQWMYANSITWPTNTDPVLGTNSIAVPPDASLVVGVDWFYGIGNTFTQVVVCDLLVDIVLTNDLGNYLGVLQGMNDSLGPYYRYETGTSMAAADVSGTLALMQEFFEQRLARTNSPALMKALLINGARSVNNLYDLNVTGAVNAQGWGLVNLPTTLPGSLTNNSAATNSMVMIDQSPTNALATGQSRTYKVSLSADAQAQPLRVTLVWTDPPGNPIASVKLVNDLDLIVTNLDNTNYVYFGNDITAGRYYNQAWIWNTNSPPNVDTVNNVENVYLTPSYGINSQLSTNYSITVVGRRVNVNAVTAQTNNVCQDYALVISSGDGGLTNAMSVDLSAGIVSGGQPLVTLITNSFANSPGYEGGILWNQRVGANPPLPGTNTLALTNDANAVLTLGVSNQWHFYVITNSNSYTNAAFLTFLPEELAVPRMGVYEPNALLATRPQADIDLYVAPPSIPNNWALTNLDPTVLDAATKSLSRGGTETIVYSNAITGSYYVGVKSEDQQAAQYALLGVFSQNPFGSSDEQGVHLVGIPLNQPIPDGSPQMPGVATIIAPCVESVQVRRVIVTNVISHELMSDLIGGFSHGSDVAVLNNHTCIIEGTACQTWTSYIYDDSSERNVGPGPNLINPTVKRTDTPGNLGVFAGKDGQGQWMLSMVDNATNHVGTNISLEIFLERQQDLTGQGITVVIQGNACRDDFIDVPVNATSLSVTVAVVSASGPIDYTVEVCPAGGGVCKSTEVTNALGGYVIIDQTDIPPLAGGTTYRIRTCNLTDQPITLNIRAAFGFSTTTIVPVLSNSATNQVNILDDAVTDIYLTNRTHSIISSVDVGLLIRDPRISDLAITLISPHGTRVLLFENRGGGSTNGLGTFALTTNYLWEPFFTNNFDAAPVGLYAPGAIFQGWNVLSNYVDVLDDYTCLCLSNHILALFDGAVSNSLPTTNSLVPSNSIPYTLSYKVNHLPWLEGMVTWWPLDVDGRDIFGGFNGVPLGDVAFSSGKVSGAFFGDGLATRMVVPRCSELDLGRGHGFSIEGWVNPGQNWVTGSTIMTNGFENAVGRFVIPAGTYVSGWHVDAGNIDLLSLPVNGRLPDSGTNFVDINGTVAGTISTNLTLVAGHTYRLTLAYTRNADSVPAGIVPQAAVSVAGNNLLTLSPSWSNTWDNLQWQHVSVMFTAVSNLSQLVVQGLNSDGYGVMFDSFLLSELIKPAGPNFGPTNVTVPGYYPYTEPAGGYAGANLWFDTGVDVTAGQILRITASGSISYGGGSGGPDGTSWMGESFMSSTLIPYTHLGSLIGKIGGTTEVYTGTLVPEGTAGEGLGFVGSSYRKIATQSGRLFLGYNDQVWFSDNSGTFSATIQLLGPSSPPAPLVEWYDPAPPTNQTPLGVQFWLSGFPGSNGVPGSLWANIWDTNSQPHIVGTVTNAITNGGWQHVALTYNTNNSTAVLYTNGQTAATLRFPTGFVPRTSGDVYLGFDPTILPTPINYPSFASTAGLNLVGNAQQVGNVLRLTPASANTLGNAWAVNKQPCAAGFETRFQFQISNYQASGGADGIAFAVQNAGGTAPVAFAPLGDGRNTFGVWFNTAYNWPGNPAGPNNDVSGNSVAIATNGANVAQVDLGRLGIILKDGNVHSSRITFDGTAMSVWLDGVMLFTNVPIPTAALAMDATGNSWVGFSAACGAAWENQDILSWTFGGPTPGTAFFGGLDEFSLYQRPLTPCEVNAIYNAGSRGKYGTNVLVCPVVTEVTLSNTLAGVQVYTFTNGVSWVTNGPHWETNTIAFSTSTNPTPIVVRGRNPYDPAVTNAANNLNAVVDDFVLTELVPQTIDGLLHFSEDTNLATIPIKFAPAPYTTSNFPPILVFTNGFQYATAGVFQAGATIPGDDNGPLIGVRDWAVTAGPVTVVSNAFFDPVSTNWLAMATGAVACQLPTIPGHRYELSYNLRGPCAVGWWNGSVDSLSQRAQDLISGNDGAFWNGATNTVAAYNGDIRGMYVGPGGFFFNGQTEPPPELDPDLWVEDVDDPASKIELADPPQLQFTNAFTIEGWIKPLPPTNGTYCGTEQIFFRGYPEPYDCRGLGDPYWLALEPALDGDLLHRELHFHIADAHTNTLGADVITTNSPIVLGGGSNSGWWHITAVFDKPWTNVLVVSNATNFITFSTNALRLYLNGVLVASNYTTISPYKDLDPALSPGATIGDRSRYDWTQPFYGYLDEVTLYARCLTEPEISAIATAGTAGKADASVAPAQSLAKLRVSLNGVPLDTAYGDNSQWGAHSMQFTATQTNTVLALQSLLPGTLLEGVTLTELPPELYYLPEVSLGDLSGEDGYGIWTLEIWDDWAGPAGTNLAQLVQWDLNLKLAPSNPPPVITLSHGIPYTNSLPAYGIQYFIVPVPQWASFATNVLQFAEQVRTSNALPVTVLFNPTNFPAITNYALIGPRVSAGTTTLAPNGTPPLTNGQPYYLALTNPNPVGVTFALGVAFDLTMLDNCQMLLSNAVSVAGIPRYFQFDVPTYATPPGLPPQAVSFWVSSTQCNLKVVLSEHLPLPDLNHYDYTSQQPCTNDQIVMLVTNTTPFPIQTNRWYAGVFNTGFTNTYFNVQACFATNYPVIIPLTNGVPFVVPFTNSPYAAPPGPPQQFFFDFVINNAEAGVLFELYNLSGDGDLVLQQAVPPTMAPYFAGSYFTGRTPEQIVLRNTPLVASDVAVADLRGHWYLGVYNNERTNLTYTIRATLPDYLGNLTSGQPLRLSLTPLPYPNGLVLSWNSVVGERYIVQYTPSIVSPITWTNIGTITATTTFTTYQIVPAPTQGFYRTVQVFTTQPKLAIQLWGTNQVRISWSTAFPGYTLQSKLGLFGTWTNVAFPPAIGPSIIGNMYVVYDPLGPVPKYYRLMK